MPISKQKLWWKAPPKLQFPEIKHQRLISNSIKFAIVGAGDRSKAGMTKRPTMIASSLFWVESRMGREMSIHLGNESLTPLWNRTEFGPVHAFFDGTNRTGPKVSPQHKFLLTTQVSVESNSLLTGTLRSLVWTSNPIWSCQWDVEEHSQRFCFECVCEEHSQRFCFECFCEEYSKRFCLSVFAALHEGCHKIGMGSFWLGKMVDVSMGFGQTLECWRTFLGFWFECFTVLHEGYHRIWLQSVWIWANGGCFDGILTRHRDVEEHSLGFCFECFAFLHEGCHRIWLESVWTWTNGGCFHGILARLK